IPGASPPGALRLDDLPQGGPPTRPLASRCPFRRFAAARETGALVQSYQSQCAGLCGIELGGATDPPDRNCTVYWRVCRFFDDYKIRCRRPAVRECLRGVKCGLANGAAGREDYARQCDGDADQAFAQWTKLLCEVGAAAAMSCKRGNAVFRRGLLACRTKLLCQRARLRKDLHHLRSAHGGCSLQVRHRARCRSGEERCEAGLVVMFGNAQEIVFTECVVEGQEFASSSFGQVAQFLGFVLGLRNQAANGFTRVLTLRDVDGHVSPPGLF